ncbi:MULTISPECIES: hypothetical protein [unclassified Methylocaldum]|jgi:hypothetical protein|uniref:hypothetical protein n=1 Tax=unclassified Methylocaldum TaxID=2622260 RepID=UPI000A320635|nr:hypothetical protein [Methylocaldum sp. RMAD-M]MBP1153076.1 hypothetical protein [Methylocaldum sp. RMAD-M]MVF24148.1 hypothetical protein [Methylocaldum sp. BRCS4]
MNEKRFQVFDGTKQRRLLERRALMAFDVPDEEFEALLEKLRPRGRLTLAYCADSPAPQPQIELEALL